MPTSTKAKPTARWALSQTMAALEKAGSAQTRKTYARHRMPEPMFGVSFATLKTLMRQIGVDHDLALALWDTGNFDARQLALKIVDPAKMTAAKLDRWARQSLGMGNYVANLAAEGPYGRGRCDAWLLARSEPMRCAGWFLVGALAMRDVELSDRWFADRLAEIVESIGAAPNDERYAMLQALILIGCRSAGLRKSVTAAGKRIGKIEIDHGETECKTPELVPTLEKTWAWAATKGFDTPAAQERAREPLRKRC